MDTYNSDISMLINFARMYMEDRFSIKINDMIMCDKSMSSSYIRSIIISPYYNYYTNFKLEHIHKKIIDRVTCLNTPVTFLSKLRYRDNYDIAINDAITIFIDNMKISTMLKNNSTINTHMYVPDCPIDILTIIHFIVLCKVYMETYGYTHNKEVFYSFFNSIIDEYVELFVEYVLNLYDGIYHSVEDVMELIADEFFIHGDLDCVDIDVDF
jgi:hypothetical protein